MISNKLLIPNASLLFLLLVTLNIMSAQPSYPIPHSLVQDPQYDPDISTPKSIIGCEIGTKPLTHHQVIEYFKYISQQSPRVHFEDIGQTHEGNTLFYAIVSSEENISNLTAIRENNQKLADPRLTNDDEAREIINHTPAIAWMGYNIHGDELSGTDAATALLYHLAAAQDDSTKTILDNVVIIIDPIQNPDGRQRTLNHIQTYTGKIPSHDIQSAQHNIQWPGGRGNHYFFDLNRDFFFLSQPETQAKVTEMLKWNPHIHVDAHEMSGLDTYLFSPSREPINRHQNQKLEDWRRKFAEDQAKAFDQFGWSYYTREWIDNWFPGYSDWITYNGAVHILHEQSETHGASLKRHDGSLHEFQTAVHQQLVSSFTNIQSLANSRQEKLQSFYDEKTESLKPHTSGEVFAYIFPPNTNQTRLLECLKKLKHQKIEITKATTSFTIQNATNTWHETFDEKECPEGSFIIYTRQPMKRLINAIFEFDPVFKQEYLNEERFYLEKFGETRLYDYSTWSIPIAYGLDCYYTKIPFTLKHQTDHFGLDQQEDFPSQQPAYGYVIAGNDDATIKAITQLLQQEYFIRVSDRAFDVHGITYPIGSFLIRNHENPDSIHQPIKQTAQEIGAQFFPANTALDLDKIDLGGRHFKYLPSPRIALLIGSSINSYSAGELWHWLDDQLQAQTTLLAIENFPNKDIRKYNVIIVPDISSASQFANTISEEGIHKLKDWINHGGSLITMGDAAKFFLESDQEFTKAKPYDKVKEKLDEFKVIFDRNKNALNAKAELNDIYQYDEKKHPQEEQDQTKPSEPNPEDEWQKRFRPHGTFLKSWVDPYHWLCYGVTNPLVVMVGEPHSYFDATYTNSPIRFVDAKDLRVSGLLWPEYRHHYAYASYLIRESIGNGQFIAFPYKPTERGYFANTTRLLWNAVFLGPGLGTTQSQPW